MLLQSRRAAAHKLLQQILGGDPNYSPPVMDVRRGVFDLPAPFRRSPTEYLRLEVSINAQCLEPGSASNGQCSRAESRLQVGGYQLPGNFCRAIIGKSIRKDVSRIYVAGIKYQFVTL